ncbi:MAG: lamin tail domain-containing protein [Nannocystaceae bacterium]|nr:lamin tail domain-containing protein [Nannocystaceae bacterium]
MVFAPLVRLLVLVSTVHRHCVLLIPLALVGCSDLRQATLPTSESDDSASSGTTEDPPTSSAPTATGEGSSSGNADMGTSDTSDPSGSSTDASSTTGSDSGRAECGNETIEGDEECDGPRLTDARCTSLLDFVGGSLSCADDCQLDTSQCTPPPRPTEGELVISEIMQNPAGDTDMTDEWFEVHNPGNEPRQLDGCEVIGNSKFDMFAINESLIVHALGYVTLAAGSDNGPGFTADFQWSSFSLNNESDTISIECGMEIVDFVAYDDGDTFPNPNGSSMALHPELLDSIANDDGENWCVGTAEYANGNFGTPGTANASCPPL